MDLTIQAVPIQRGPKAEHLSYLASFSFGTIARMLDDGRLYVPNQAELPDFAQRKPNPTRIKAIVQYILTTYQEGSTFFPPICVNVQPVPIYRNESILLPFQSVIFRLTDGQHRCLAISQALRDITTSDSKNLPIISQLEVGVLLYAGLSIDLERQAFRDQNLLVQRPSVSLAHNFDQRSPIVLIAKGLIGRVPQFRNNIEMVENGIGKHNSKLMTLSTLVAATHHMFPNLSSKKDLEFRLDWASTFWAAVASNLPGDPWRPVKKEERSQQRQTNLTVTAVVIQAFGSLGYDLYKEGVSEGDLMQWLMRLSEINWQREEKMWRERGVTQVGAKGEPIIQNTRTTVDACHRVLREFIGVAAAA